jgi:hypothetical protein
MAQFITRATIVQFLLGFIIGKLIGAIVSTMPFFDLIFDSSVYDIFWTELVNNILAFNGYHYALAIIGGLILAIWKSNDLFE